MLTLYHNPQSRSTTIHYMLHEIGEPFEIVPIELKTGEHKRPEFLKINPMGKLPVLSDGDVIVTETPAILTYLADKYPKAGLAPAIDSPEGATYLRWLFFYGSAFEPAINDKFNKVVPLERASPYGSFEAVITTLTDQLAKGPFLLGEKKTVADVLWGGALGWVTMFGLVEKTPLIAGYMQRCQSPANATVMALDQKLSAEHEAALKA